MPEGRTHGKNPPGKILLCHQPDVLRLPRRTNSVVSPVNASRHAERSSYCQQSQDQWSQSYLCHALCHSFNGVSIEIMIVGIFSRGNRSPIIQTETNRRISSKECPMMK